MRINLIPAYGRDYKSKKALEADWNEGKDFLIADISSPDDGRYINLQDAKTAGITDATIRYQRLTKVAAIKIR